MKRSISLKLAYYLGEVTHKGLFVFVSPGGDIYAGLRTLESPGKLAKFLENKNKFIVVKYDAKAIKWYESIINLKLYELSDYVHLGHVEYLGLINFSFY